MTTAVRTTKKSRLIKRYHTLCAKLGMSRDHKEAILVSYGVCSSTALDELELEQICTNLANQVNPKPSQTDKMRKRVMAAIGGWLRLVGHEQNADKIKGIACRATGYKHFNRIPKNRLNNLYHAFVNKQKDFKAVGHITNDEIELLSRLN